MSAFQKKSHEWEKKGRQSEFLALNICCIVGETGVVKHNKLKIVGLWH